MGLEVNPDRTPFKPIVDGSQRPAIRIQALRCAARENELTQPCKKSGKASVAGATLLAVAAAVCHAEQSDQGGSRAGDPPADDDYVVLPPIVVTPNESFDPWFNYDRSLRAIQRSLPGLDTDRPRKRDPSEMLMEGLGLTGEGIHGLHPAEQARLEALLETVNGDPRP